MDICVYECDSVLTFGKYKNRSLLDINQINTSYIDWCLTRINNFCVSEESMRTLMQLFPKMQLSKEAFRANQFKQEVAKLNDSDIGYLIYETRLIELYEIYRDEIGKSNIEIWD